MRRLAFSAPAATALFALAMSAVPAVASSPDGIEGEQAARVDARLLAVSRVVEVVEVGEIGSGEPPVIRKRTLRGSKAGEARRLKLDVARATVESHREACYYARPSWRRYNGFGKLSSKAWYYIEWCGKDGRVSKVLTLSCGGVAAGGFSYDGCKVRRGAVGYRKVNISGEWSFPFRVSVYTLVTRTVTVTSRHYPTGRYSGTWWMYQ